MYKSRAMEEPEIEVEKPPLPPAAFRRLWCGLLAPFLLIGILAAASDQKLMNGQPSSRLARWAVGATATLMFAAAVGMFVF